MRISEKQLWCLASPPNSTSWGQSYLEGYSWCLSRSRLQVSDTSKSSLSLLLTLHYKSASFIKLSPADLCLSKNIETIDVRKREIVLQPQWKSNSKHPAMKPPLSPQDQITYYRDQTSLKCNPPPHPLWAPSFAGVSTSIFICSKWVSVPMLYILSFLRNHSYSPDLLSVNVNQPSPMNCTRAIPQSISCTLVEATICPLFGSWAANELMILPPHIQDGGNHGIGQIQHKYSQGTH